MNISEAYDWVNLTPEEGEYLFGYYDRCPWNEDDSLHLALKTSPLNRLPLPGETAEVGYINRDEKRFVKMAKTRAWCHQQGAMTLWLRQRKNVFVFNDYLESEKKPCARIMDISGSELGRYDRPVYSISGDGKWAASLNFGRIPRRGYSYADLPLACESEIPDLDNDGLFIIELGTGKQELIVPYREFINAHPIPYSLAGSYYYLAHAVFNCDSSRIMILFEQIGTQNEVSSCLTSLFTVNIDGSELLCPLPSPYWRENTEGGADRISHQLWGRFPREIIVDANWCRQGNQYVVFDESKPSLRAEKISDGFGPHGHLVFSPDNRWLAADTYPDSDNVERLGLVDTATGELTKIGRFRHHPASELADLRCDLHPRWSHNSKTITVDTIHDRQRKIYLLDLK
jgi:hypothetical protein